MSFDKPVDNDNHYSSNADREHSDTKRRRSGNAIIYSREEVRERSAMIEKIRQRYPGREFDYKYYEDKTTQELRLINSGDEVPQWDPRAPSLSRLLSVIPFGFDRLSLTQVFLASRHFGLRTFKKTFTIES